MIADNGTASNGGTTGAMITHDGTVTATVVVAAAAPAMSRESDTAERHAEDRCNSESASHAGQRSAGEM